MHTLVKLVFFSISWIQIIVSVKTNVNVIKRIKYLLSCEFMYTSVTFQKSNHFCFSTVCWESSWGYCSWGSRKSSRSRRESNFNKKPASFSPVHNTHAKSSSMKSDNSNLYSSYSITLLVKMTHDASHGWSNFHVLDQPYRRPCAVCPDISNTTKVSDLLLWNMNWCIAILVPFL